jgi:hypothetical protein
MQYDTTDKAHAKEEVSNNTLQAQRLSGAAEDKMKCNCRGLMT